MFLEQLLTGLLNITFGRLVVELLNMDDKSVIPEFFGILLIV